MEKTNYITTETKEDGQNLLTSVIITGKSNIAVIQTKKFSGGATTQIQHNNQQCFNYHRDNYDDAVKFHKDILYAIDTL